MIVSYRSVSIASSDSAQALHAQAAALAKHVRLTLQNRTWKGAIGNWAGAGSGSSIDFQDHRPYLPGDDPRYIDWAAYARSGQYIMKLYREEVSPRVDLLFDASRSMLYQPAKRRRAIELMYFCAESATSLGGSLYSYAITGRQHQRIMTTELLSGRWMPDVESETDPAPPDFKSVPLRPLSLRLIISDLLFDAPPESMLRPLTAAKGRMALLAPYARDEADPAWSHNMELVDCESFASRRQRVDSSLLERYHDAYARHFDAWRDQARRCNARLARVPCEPGLGDALRAEALPNGVVEAWT